MKLFPGVVLLFLAAYLSGFSPANAQSDYRSAENPHYWKNRKPFEGYWQQDVHYRMNVTVNDDEETVSGTEQLTYWNNSPDTLHVVYFHLYQNAFQPGSDLHNLRISGKLTTIFGAYEKEGKGTVISKLECSHGVKQQQLMSTLLKITLDRPVMPGSSAIFDIEFKTYWDKDDAGNIRRRMKTFYHGEEFRKRFKHFDGVHWYPRIAVYDRKFGWTTDQHLGKEFYGDYGSFDVDITFPAKYVVEATGKLVNRDEMLPTKLREELDISNFKTRRDIYTGITENLKGPDGSGQKTWKFRAVNVHDFAFTADPTYRIGEVMLDGIRCIALAQEENAHNWQPTAEFVSNVVAVYNRDFGKYAYPKIVAADARDGMEYPMITLNSGTWPGHKYVIAHEVGHNWFFGMVGNNETYRASLDEGFTQFLTAWSLKKISGADSFLNPYDDNIVFSRYIEHASDENTARLNIHSDHFNSAERHGGGYGQVYYKTATMLYNLQYVLGDDLFQRAMKNYFNQWKFCHPYWADFRSSVIRYTKVDLNWFFDEWLENSTFIDYKVQGIRKGDQKNSYRITILRKGMQMPIDLTVIDKQGVRHQYHIPNTQFVKDHSGTVLPMWYGWDMLNPSYTAEVDIPAGIRNIVIDESGRMADINRLNNSKKGTVDVRFDKMRQMPSDFRKYYFLYRPDFWYNNVDGIKAGLAFRGGFNDRRHLINARVWYNTGLMADDMDDTGDPFPVNFMANYTTRVGKLLDLKASARYIDGFTMNAIGLYKSLSVSNSLEVSAQHMMRDNDRFVFHPELWDEDRHDVTLNMAFVHRYHYFRGNGRIELGLRTSGPYSDYAYSRASIEVINNSWIGKLQFRTRTYAALITGQGKNPASLIMLAGANEEELMDNKLTRSTGIIPDDWMGYAGELGNFHLSGGLNLRGYSGYSAMGVEGSDTFTIHYGDRGAALNAELDFTRLIMGSSGRWWNVVNPGFYLFGDAGLLARGVGTSDLRADAGIGSTWTIHLRRGYSPFTVRVDFPLFLNRIPAADEEFVTFRYLVGLKKAF